MEEAKGDSKMESQMMRFNNLSMPMPILGKDVSFVNLHGGFTHILASTFESIEDVAKYVHHPVHVEFGNLYHHNLEKFLIFDYKPTIFLP
ncbi:hypothetical protein G4B88_025607 [Cannabis sativa]|uniref:Stress-response A/B barrel domain-containing protein n=1 Tax=Cannabis sativa TaxID=3483 RepID=A0A7J6F2N2_CANSA|nr:hypothetical protein G4B88_025607 [Cannabis sativa]